MSGLRHPVISGAMRDPFFFGYGSLVNRRTHAYDRAHPARLGGWRRTWAHTTLRRAAFLSAEPCEGVEIDGLIAAVPGADWAALDRREAAYRRVPVAGLVAHAAGDALQIEVYRVDETLLAAQTSHPILLSYLDAVVQGFLHAHGPSGVERFFDTTTGWEAPLHDDRSAPLYPRAQVLAPTERRLVDLMLARVA